jgi:hypothetical protein
MPGIHVRRLAGIRAVSERLHAAQDGRCARGGSRSRLVHPRVQHLASYGADLVSAT